MLAGLEPRLKGKSLHEYDFYPCRSTAAHFAGFSRKDFRLGLAVAFGPASP
jgi:hypothetical protein